MTKKMEKALTTIERRINNYLAMAEREWGKEEAYRQYHEFDKMLDAMFLNDLLNEKDYIEASDELREIRRRTLWA